MDLTETALQQFRGAHSKGAYAGLMRLSAAFRVKAPELGKLFIISQMLRLQRSRMQLH